MPLTSWPREHVRAEACSPSFKIYHALASASQLAEAKQSGNCYSSTDEWNSIRIFFVRHFCDMFWSLFTMTILGLATFHDAKAGFDTKQPVLQPLIPRQHGLMVELNSCGAWNSRICKTECGKTIPVNKDLLARLAWTDKFDAHPDWDAADDRLLAVPDSLPMATGILDRFLEQSNSSTAAWKERRTVCEETCNEYYEVVSQGYRPINEPIAEFLQATFRDIDTYFKMMLLDQLKVWYARDMLRRIRAGIETGCPSIAFTGVENDPCESGATDLTIRLP